MSVKTKSKSAPLLVIDKDGFILQVIVDGERYPVDTLRAIPANENVFLVGDLAAVQVGDTTVVGRVVAVQVGAPPRVICKPSKITIQTSREKHVTRTVEYATRVS